MKKFKPYFILLTVAILFSINTIAQQTKKSKSEVPLKPLFELFTSSTCAPCAYANPIFDAMLEENPGTHSVIKYQVNWPGTGDPYYTAEVGVRTSYYGVSSVPTLFVNSDEMHPVDCTQEVYDTYQGLTTSLAIEVNTAEIDLSNILSIDVNINALDDYASGLKAHVAVVEKTTVENTGSNGELEFHYVMMKMFPDASGTTLDALTTGDSENLNFSYDMSQTNMETANDLELIVFVQDDSDKSIIQSEQIIIESELLDYSISIEVIDEDSNPIEGAELFLEGYGTKFSDANGNILYHGVLPGTYAYNMIASGLIPAEGEIVVIDQDVSIEIIMQNPGYYYYEDFTTEIPANYTLHVSSPDFLYMADGKVIFFRQSGTDAPLMLVAELIDITPGEKIFFDLGEAGGMPSNAVFGTVSDPNDPSTFTEIATLTPDVPMQTFEYVLEEILPGQVDVYFAWYLSGTDMSYFSFDNIKINYGQTGEEHYNVNFQVFDGAEPVADAEITINGFTHSTNSNGDALFEDLPNGMYDYTIEAYGFLHFEGNLTIDGNDVFEQVNLLIDGINGSVENDFKIYPNPAVNELYIQGEETINNMILMNTAGQFIYNTNPASNEAQISLEELIQGIYILQIETNNQIIKKKIIKK